MQSVPNYLQIENIDDFIAFLEGNFNTGPVTNGVSHIASKLLKIFSKYEYRKTPSYLRFLARVLLLAAEFGYPQIDWLVLEFVRSGKDLFDPRYLVWTAYYLSDINIKVWNQKVGSLSDTPLDQYKDRFNSVALPKKGQVSFDQTAIDLRSRTNLPHYLPDFKFIEGVENFRLFLQDIMPTNIEADYDKRMQYYFKDVANLTPKEYIEKYGPFLKKAFPTIDIDSLFGEGFQAEMKINFN